MSANDDISGLSHYNITKKFSQGPNDANHSLLNSDPEYSVQSWMPESLSDQVSNCFQTTTKPSAVKMENFIDSASCLKDIPHSNMSQRYTLNLQSSPSCELQLVSSDKLNSTSHISSNFESQSGIETSCHFNNAKDSSLHIKTNYLVQNSVQRSQGYPINTTASLAQKVDFPSNNATGKQYFLKSEQNRFSTPNLLSPPTHQMEEYTTSPNNLYSKSYISSISQTQLKHNDLPILPIEEQQENKQSNFQGFNYRVGGGNNTGDPKTTPPPMIFWEKYFTNVNSDLQNDEQNLICPHCQKTFQHKSSLRMHLQLHMTNTPQYTCPIAECGRIFNQKGNLKKHMYGYGEDSLCPRCNQKMLCRGSMALHLKTHIHAKGKRQDTQALDIHENVDPNVSNKNSYCIRDSQNISQPTSMVQTTSTSSTHVKLSDNAYIRSSSKARSKKRRSVPPASSEMNLLVSTPAKDKYRFNSPYGTLRTSLDTSKDQSSSRDSLPTVHLSTTLSSLNDTLLHEAGMSQKDKRMDFVCPNYSVDSGNKFEDANDKLEHVCYYPDCGKVFNNIDHLKRHIGNHSTR